MLVVGCTTVAAFSVFVVQNVVTHLLHTCYHFACMTWMNPVIPRGGSEQHPGVLGLLFEVVVRGESLDECPFGRLIGVAILSRPTGTGQQLGVALHIQKRDLANDGSEQLRVLREHVTHQQAAVAAPLNSQMFGRSDLPLDKILGDSSEREVKRLEPLVSQINDLERDLQALSDERLRETTHDLRHRLLSGETLDDLLPEAFAAVREAARRTIGQRHYDVQLLAGIVLHQGKIAEMRTGEGKTLVATLPLYLNALEGKGCHLVTPNDYLSRVGGGWMGPVYNALGLTVGVITHETSAIYDPDYLDPQPHGDARLDHWRPVSRREAYLADITYGTNNEFGFDYLRDNMVWDLNQKAQRELHYAIVDEVDNILIDEARTPLIISGQADESTDKYYLLARIVPRLRKDVDFKIDEKIRAVTLTEEGIEAVERALKVDNLYAPENFDLTHYLEQALRAQFVYRRDRDYVLYRDGRVLEPHQHHPEAEVVIVDEFTGRLMHGRRFSEGLHQAIEAKENVKIQRENQTLATITFQNYFRMYSKLAGMTGTALTEKEEFQQIYGLDVVVIPTHRPMIRVDLPDLVYKTERAKMMAVLDDIVEANKAGRPVLVGTVSIERSEQISDLLRKRGIEHQVLNAKYHEQEALIIAQAGRSGRVTIATNMAGRGVDILLGGNPTGLAEEIVRKRVRDREVTPEDRLEALKEAERECAADRERVLKAGGLHVVGTERHEARRIDNQLRGRAGRQGDPGSSRFYVSLEDDLMRRFGGSNIAGIMERLGLEENVPIEHGLVTKSIESAQVKVEGHNFDIRKHVVQYDDVMNKQRATIYGERMKVLSRESLRDSILEMMDREVAELVNTYCAASMADEWDLDGLAQAIRGLMPVPPEFGSADLEGFTRDELIERLQALALKLYDEKEQALGSEDMRRLERIVMLHTIDRLWAGHLTAMEDLREGIGLRAYGQRDPLVEYKSEAFAMFQSLQASIQHEIVQTVFHVTLQRAPATPKPRAIQTNREDAQSQGPVRARGKVGRNDPCPCGSGKKYKRCHGRAA